MEINHIQLRILRKLLRPNHQDQGVYIRTYPEEDTHHHPHNHNNNHSILVNNNNNNKATIQNHHNQLFLLALNNIKAQFIRHKILIPKLIVVVSVKPWKDLERTNKLSSKLLLIDRTLNDNRSNFITKQCMESYV